LGGAVNVIDAIVDVEVRDRLRAREQFVERNSTLGS